MQQLFCITTQKYRVRLRFFLFPGGPSVVKTKLVTFFSLPPFTFCPSSIELRVCIRTLTNKSRCRNRSSCRTVHGRHLDRTLLLLLLNPRVNDDIHLFGFR